MAEPPAQRKDSTHKPRGSGVNSLEQVRGPEIQTVTTASRTLQSGLPEPGFECRKSGPQSDAGNGGAAGPRVRGGGEAVLGLGVGAQLCRAVMKGAPERAPEPSKPHEAAVSPGVRGGGDPAFRSFPPQPGLSPGLCWAVW